MSGGLSFKPVTATTLGDFEALFGAPGAPKYCWCMAWRATSDELKHASSASRHSQMRGRIADQVQVGLLAYADKTPIGWVSVAPKDTFRSLGGPDSKDTIWSLTCLFVAKEHRKTGLSAQLIQAAASFAKQHGADLLEAYPVDPDSPSYRFMGFVPAFERLGFKPIARAGKRRHIMRLDLDPS
jgi:GNAT superfamily N-acetyltransferase